MMVKSAFNLFPLWLYSPSIFNLFTSFLLLDCNFCYCCWTSNCFVLFYKGYAKIWLIYSFLLNRIGMFPILCGIYSCLYNHMIDLSFFLNPILNFYWSHGLLEALVPLWGRCCLAVYLLCCRWAAGFDKVWKVALAPDELFCYFSDHFSSLTEWFLVPALLSSIPAVLALDNQQI